MSESDAPKIAIALRYAWGDGAPAVVANGRGDTAAAIVERALQHEVPVHADADLARLLAQVPVGTGIPPAAFLAVAQILSFLFDVDAMTRSASDR